MDIGELLIRLNADTKPLGNGLAEAEKGLSQLNSSAERQFAGLGNAFTRLFTQVAKGDLAGILDGIIRVVQSLPTSSGAGSRSGGFSIGRLVNDGIGAALSSMMGSGRALGGAVTGGGSVLVGERGPELFTPHTSGMIAPNNQLAAGNSITLNMTVVAQDAHSFRASQGQIMADAAMALRRAGRYS